MSQFITIPAGPTGSPGTAGSKIYTGSGVPSGSLGASGDIYINTANGDYYQKVGSSWGSPIGNLYASLQIGDPVGGSTPGDILVVDGSGNLDNIAILPIASGGTGQITANAAFNALAPSQTGKSGDLLTTDGTNTSWTASIPATSIAIGIPVTGGHPQDILFIDSGGLLTQSDSFTFDGGLLSVTNIDISTALQLSWMAGNDGNVLEIDDSGNIISSSNFSYVSGSDTLTLNMEYIYTPQMSNGVVFTFDDYMQTDPTYFYYDLDSHCLMVGPENEIGTGAYGMVVGSGLTINSTGNLVVGVAETGSTAQATEEAAFVQGYAFQNSGFYGSLNGEGQGSYTGGIADGGIITSGAAGVITYGWCWQDSGSYSTVQILTDQPGSITVGHSYDGNIHNSAVGSLLVGHAEYGSYIFNSSGHGSIVSGFTNSDGGTPGYIYNSDSEGNIMGGCAFGGYIESESSQGLLIGGLAQYSSYVANIVGSNANGSVIWTSCTDSTVYTAADGNATFGNFSLNNGTQANVSNYGSGSLLCTFASGSELEINSQGSCLGGFFQYNNNYTSVEISGEGSLTWCYLQDSTLSVGGQGCTTLGSFTSNNSQASSINNVGTAGFISAQVSGAEIYNTGSNAIFGYYQYNGGESTEISVGGNANLVSLSMQNCSFSMGCNGSLLLGTMQPYSGESPTLSMNTDASIVCVINNGGYVYSNGGMILGEADYNSNQGQMSTDGVGALVHGQSVGGNMSAQQGGHAFGYVSYQNNTGYISAEQGAHAGGVCYGGYLSAQEASIAHAYVSCENNNASAEANSTASFVFAYVSAGGSSTCQVSASGNGSLAGGYANQENNTTQIQAQDNGTFAWGWAQDGTLNASQTGAIALGAAQGDSEYSAEINSYGQGSLAGGFSYSSYTGNTTISTNTYGGIAWGYAYANASIQSGGPGCIALGYTQGNSSYDSEIYVGGNGGFGGGYIINNGNASSQLNVSGNGSIAWGNIQDSGINLDSDGQVWFGKAVFNDTESYVSLSGDAHIFMGYMEGSEVSQNSSLACFVGGAFVLNGGYQANYSSSSGTANFNYLYLNGGQAINAGNASIMVGEADYNGESQLQIINYGNCSLLVGYAQNSDHQNNGNMSAMIGSDSNNQADFSVLLGQANQNYQTYSMLQGASNSNNATYSQIFGNNNANNGGGDYSILQGNSHTNSGQYSQLFGYNHTNSGNYATLIGEGLSNTGPANQIFWVGWGGSAYLQLSSSECVLSVETEVSANSLLATFCASGYGAKFIDASSDYVNILQSSSENFLITAYDSTHGLVFNFGASSTGGGAYFENGGSGFSLQLVGGSYCLYGDGPSGYSFEGCNGSAGMVGILSSGGHTLTGKLGTSSWAGSFTHDSSTTADLAGASYAGSFSYETNTTAYLCSSSVAGTLEDSSSNYVEICNGTDAILAEGIVSIRANSSATFSKAGGMILTHYADAGNSGTSPTNLYDDTINGNLLTNAGDSISGTISGIFVGSATATCELSLVFAGYTIIDTGSLSITSNSSWNIKFTIICVDSTHVRMIGEFTCGTSSTQVSYSTISVTLSSNQVLRSVGTSSGVGAASNAIVAKMMTMTWNPTN